MSAIIGVGAGTTCPARERTCRDQLQLADIIHGEADVVRVPADAPTWRTLYCHRRAVEDVPAIIRRLHDQLALQTRDGDTAWRSGGSSNGESIMC